MYVNEAVRLHWYFRIFSEWENQIHLWPWAGKGPASSKCTADNAHPFMSMPNGKKSCIFMFVLPPVNFPFTLPPFTPSYLSTCKAVDPFAKCLQNHYKRHSELLFDTEIMLVTKWRRYMHCLIAVIKMRCTNRNYPRLFTVRLHRDMYLEKLYRFHSALYRLLPTHFFFCTS